MALQHWANGLHYTRNEQGEEELVDGDGHCVVVSFDKEEIVKAIDDLVVPEGSAVLEVGFGLGFSAERIQRARPSSHVIVEFAPTVLQRLREWAKDRPSVTIVEGSWQTKLPQLGKFDRIFFDGSKDLEPNVAEMKRCGDAEHRALYKAGLRETTASKPVFGAFEERKESYCGRIIDEPCVGGFNITTFGPPIKAVVKAAVRALHSNAEAKVLNSEGSEFRQWADGFFFATDQNGKEQLLDCDGAQIMMEWEKPYMEACVADLAIDGTCDVLEVGFGCGYSAERIQRQQPRSHTIIECSEPVLQRLRVWAAERPNVRVVEGTWQARLPDLGNFDRIFFDDWGQPGLADREMSQCTRREYKDQYDTAFDHENGSHFEGFVRIVMTYHAREGTRVSGFMMREIEDLSDVGVTSEYRYVHVEPPEHCNYFFSDRALVPLFLKGAPPAPPPAARRRRHGARAALRDASGGDKSEDDDGGSTRSGSHSSERRARSRSRSPRAAASSGAAPLKGGEMADMHIALSCAGVDASNA